MDNFNGITVHLNHRDITMVAVSLAPYEKLAAYKKRMGWTFPWFSSVGSDFNFDYHVSFAPDQLTAGNVEYNYHPFQWSTSEAPGISVFSQRCWQHLSHVLHLRPRPGYAERRLPLHGPGPEGTRRGPRSTGWVASA